LSSVCFHVVNFEIIVKGRSFSFLVHKHGGRNTSKSDWMCN